MLSDLPPIYVNLDRILNGIRAPHPKGLFICVQLAAIQAEIEPVLFYVKKIVKFIHEDLRLKAISGILKVV